MRSHPVPRQPNFCAADAREWAEGFGPLPGRYALSGNYVYGATQPVAVPGRERRVRVRPGDFAYFRELEPVARAGYSIYVYDILVEQANDLRKRACLPPLDASRYALREPRSASR